jgi:transcriptional regulator with GAF, ATPase, and Fis domain
VSEAPKIIGRSACLRETLRSAGRVARTALPVLVLGESGTGKELFARHLHEQSGRAAGPFVAVNCAAIPRDLLESELFGHERGAFTGALAAQAGAFERARGGTLFLDEVGELALEHQAKLLRALQEGEIQRVGGSAPRPVDVRVVAATNRGLRERAGAGLFREDLYYRLAGYELRLPPLRERGGDVALLAKALLRREFPAKVLTRAAEQVLQAHAWPGNVRELQNVVRTLAVDARGRRITEEAVRRLPTFAGAKAAEGARTTESELATLEAALAARGRISAAEVRELLGVGKTRAFQLLAAWKRKGGIVRRGCGRGIYYVARVDGGEGDT